MRLGVALLVVAVALAGLWLARKPIARGFVDRTFAAAKVPARYTIEELAVGHQRLTDVVVGDPRRPDLVADWVELTTSVGVNGVTLVGVSAGNVRARGRIVDGVLSLGSLDRLMPKSRDAFGLPAIALNLGDGRLRLDTPQGAIGIKASGRGRLDGGFHGKIAAVSDRIASGACAAEAMATVFAVNIRADAIRLRGPVRAKRVGCTGSGVEGLRADVDASVGPKFDRWHSAAKLSADRASAPSVTMAGLAGDTTFAGTARSVQGKTALIADRLAGRGIAGRAGAIDGAFRYVGGKGAFTGQARIGHAAMAAGSRASFAAIGGGGQGMPVAPLTAQLARSLDLAARDFALTTDLSAATDGTRGSVTLTRLRATSVSGANVTLTSSEGTQFIWPNGGVTVRGVLAMGGGGLPEVHATLAQAAIGAPVTGVATMAPYAVGGARLALTPVRFSAALDGRTRIESVATLTGPIGTGSVEALRMPLTAQWDGRGRLAINPACAPVSVERLSVGGLDARRTATQLCPVDGAMLRIAGGRIGGGVIAHNVQLAGAIGGSPLALRAGSAVVRLGERRFDLTGVAVRIGRPERLTRFDAARLDGKFGQMLAGTFGGAGGQIVAVPLLLSDAAGTWRMEGDKLQLVGAMAVRDAAADPRFNPLSVSNVALTLADNRITATGVLEVPDHRVKVADVAIIHDLSRGLGSADLTVTGLRFAKGFQPDTLTPLTTGVVADVAGVVNGEGHIRWTPDGVTSDGVFRTANTSLAAAFGPVTGLSGEIRFTDLLGLISAPDQVATVGNINTGVAVSGGTIRYRLLGPGRIDLTEAVWPFAGGQLTLDPATLDFLDPGGRRLTFRLTGVDAAQFLQQFDFGNLSATGIFDGTLPMIFDAKGGRIENGRLKVRAGGGTLAYVGEVSKANLGTWGNMAFDALKSLRYRSLELTMNGALAGEVITEAKFAGIAQGEGAKSNFLTRRIAKLPFVFNVRIRAPFRSLVDSATSFYDPRRLIERNLPALIREQNARQRPVQPPASEKVR